MYYMHANYARPPWKLTLMAHVVIKTVAHVVVSYF